MNITAVKGVFFGHGSLGLKCLQGDGRTRTELLSPRNSRKMQSWTLLDVVGSLALSHTSAASSVGGSFPTRSVTAHFTKLPG